jgi:hypothetical protein
MSRVLRRTINFTGIQPAMAAYIVLPVTGARMPCTLHEKQKTITSLNNTREAKSRRSGAVVFAMTIQEEKAAEVNLTKPTEERIRAPKTPAMFAIPQSHRILPIGRMAIPGKIQISTAPCKLILKQILRIT